MSLFLSPFANINLSITDIVLSLYSESESGLNMKIFSDSLKPMPIAFLQSINFPLIPFKDVSFPTILLKYF